MSCVVGISQKGIVYIGGDSLCSFEGEVRHVTTPKVFKNNDYLIGFCGNVRQGQLLYSCCWKPPINIVNFVDEIRRHFDKKGCLKTGENGEDLCGCNFLIGFKKKLYEIHANFQIVELEDNFSAIGEGSVFALGSLYETSKKNSGLNIEPTERIIRSLNCSSYFCSSVGGDFNILEI